MEEIWNGLRHRADADPLDALDAFATRAAAGDKVAFEGIYALLVDDLYAYARANAASDLDAEDIVATVFLRAWQYARRYRAGTRSYRRWVFGIARNEVRNAWRAQRDAREIADAVARSSADEQHQSAAPRIDVTDLDRVIAQLSRDQRDVILLRFVNGKSHAEVAALLGKSEDGVRALQHRALRKLRSAVTNAPSQG